jgi:hypothetical protein
VLACGGGDPPPQAGRKPARPWAVGQKLAQSPVNHFSISLLNLNSTKSFKLPKFIENHSILRKIQSRFWMNPLEQVFSGNLAKSPFSP